jgi:hypothetical protein
MEPMFRYSSLDDYRADICSYLADSARGAPKRINMCDTWTVKCGGRYDTKNWPVKKMYVQITADAQTSTGEICETTVYKYSRCTDIDFRIKSRCIAIDSREYSSVTKRGSTEEMR